MKKPAGSVRFGFYKQKTKKTEPNWTETETDKKPEKNPSQTEPNRKKPSQNRAKPVWTGFCPKKPNRTETSRFDPVSVRFRFFFQKKNSVWLLFLIKTEPNRKWSPLTDLIWNFMVSDWLWLGKVLETLAHLT